jgi:hypothetical protein
MRTIAGLRILSLGILVGTTLVAFFLWGSYGDLASASDNSNSFGALVAPVDEGVRRQILKAATVTFQPSLEMKENADFLLTPALLVQDIIEEDVVVTYPSE